MKYQNIAFIFPGQGAQYPGMGRDFAENYSIARETFEEADDLLHRKLSQIVWQGPDSLLTETQNSQTGIYVASMALLRVLKQLFPGIISRAAAGLSLGEYSALTAAGILDFATCLNLVEKRGKFMSEACEKNKGTMAVVMGLSSEQVEDIVHSLRMPEELFIANMNCPGQVVISGTLRGVEAGSLRAKENGAKRVIPLQVHGAFHSGLMRSAEDKLRNEIQKTEFKKSNISLVMNYSGEYVHQIDEMRLQLIKQVTSPVRWEKSVRTMVADGVDLFIEIGCGKTLSGMVKRIESQVTSISIEKTSDIDLAAKELSA